MHVSFDEKVPPDFIPLIEERLKPSYKYFPTWVHELVIFFDGEPTEGESLRCIPEYHYRLAQIYVTTQFFLEELWEIGFYHEIFHLYFRPYTDKTEAVVEMFANNEEFKRYFLKELEKAEEECAQDFARLMGLLTEFQGNAKVEQ